MGYRVFAGVRNPADGEALKTKASKWLAPLLLDVTDEASIKKAAETVAASVGAAGLAGLVNNGGIGVGGPLEVVPLADVRKQFEVNVIGQVAVTQAFLPLLRQGRGRIVNMGSIAGRATMPFMGPYSASKFALEALTDAMRMELQPWGIHVSIVEPGAIESRIWDKARQSADEMEAAADPEAKARYGEAVARVREAMAEAAQRAIPARVVAEAVAHALRAARPKTRYLVGLDARFRAVLAAWLPDRVEDWLVRRVLKLPK
ncbi:MAG: short-chain dehydrogenase/reductase [Nitrospirae bacterium RIFCSPLOWO2_12_FULL_63_8]|nr:MAG: short-chain dehydrogenase/reductase [Nitrospirae bacterium RIFCSPLOWO2_12_FULL_63_8]